MQTYTKEFTDREEKKVASYQAPANAEEFKSWVATLKVSEESTPYVEGQPYRVGTLDEAFDEFMYAMETHAKQKLREQAAVESTVITRDGRKIDLMVIPVAKSILVVNAGFAMAMATESAPPSALAATRKKLLAESKVKEQGPRVAWDYKDGDKNVKGEFATLVVA